MHQYIVDIASAYKSLPCSYKYWELLQRTQVYRFERQAWECISPFEYLRLNIRKIFATKHLNKADAYRKFMVLKLIYFECTPVYQWYCLCLWELTLSYRVVRVASTHSSLSIWEAGMGMYISFRIITAKHSISNINTIFPCACATGYWKTSTRTNNDRDSTPRRNGERFLTPARSWDEMHGSYSILVRTVLETFS